MWVDITRVSCTRSVVDGVVVAFGASEVRINDNTISELVAMKSLVIGRAFLTRTRCESL